MIIDIIGTRFVARCTREEAPFLKAVGFVPDLALKRLVTDDPYIAVKVWDHLTPEAMDYIDAFAARQREDYVASWREDTDFEPVYPDAIDPRTGKPFAPLAFQKAGVEFALPKWGTLIADEPGLGKGHPLTTRIVTPFGYRPLGDLVPGDLVITQDGSPTRITAIHERGVLPILRFLTSDGESIETDHDHLWLVYDEVAADWITLEAREIARRIDLGEEPQIPVIANPVRYAHKTFDIQPDIAPTLHYAPGVFATDLPHDIDPMDYATGSVTQRVQFLGALIAHRARAWGRRTTVTLRFNPVTEQRWVAATREIVQSLGGLAFNRYPIGGMSLSRRDALVMTIALPWEIAKPVFSFRRERPTNAWKKASFVLPARRLVDCTDAGTAPVRCISVAHPSKLYACDHYIVTHNTVQAIMIANTDPEVRTGLIIPPANLRVNWQREWQRWDAFGRSIAIAQRVTYQRNKVKHTEYRFPDTDWVIVNYDMLAAFEEQIRARSWDMLVTDESHYLRNSDSIRTTMVFGGFIKADKKKGTKRRKVSPIIPVRREVHLTGTPILARPRDLWPLIKRLDPTGLGRDEEAFYYRYCGAFTDPSTGDLDTTGSSNLDELNVYLRSTFMVRRLKSDVLKDLPAKMRSAIVLPKEGLDRKLAAEGDAIREALLALEQAIGTVPKDPTYEDVQRALRRLNALSMEEYEEAIAGKDGGIDKDTPLFKLAVARQELAVAKVPMVVEHVRSLMDAGHKVIVFAYHRRVIEELQRSFNGSVTVYGGMSAAAKQSSVDRFQDDPDVNPFLGQMVAAGVGYTLTAAKYVVFAELSWLPAELLQAEDRAHRIGQQDTVFAQYLVVEDSFDDRQMNAVFHRMRMIEQALDQRQIK